MKNYQKLLLLSAVLGFAGTLANAQEEALYLDNPAGTSESDLPADSLNLREIYVMVEGFALAPDDQICDNARPYSYGAWLTAGTSFGEGSLAWDFGAIFAAGIATDNPERWEVDKRFDGTVAARWQNDYDLTQTDYLFGLQAGISLEIDETFIISLGAMAGVDYREIEVENSGCDFSESDSALGFFYGAYLRGSVQLTRRWALTASYRLMKTSVDISSFSASDKFVTESGEFNISPEKSNLYQGFTFGLKYSF